VDRRQCSIEPLTGGLTNIIYLVKLSSDTQLPDGVIKTVLVRQFGQGTEAFIDRGREALIYEVFSNCGAGPSIIGNYKGGRLEQFFPSTRIECKSLGEPHNLRTIASMLGHIHCADALNLSGKDNAQHKFIQDLRSWASKASATSFPDDSSKQEKVSNMKVRYLLEEMEVLIAALSCVDSKIVLCHNDLHEGNILESNDGSGELKLIDFEYSDWGPRGYDLGNLFCEMSVDNFVEGELGFKYSSTAYPSKQMQVAFFREYLLAQHIKAEDMEQEMEKLYVEANMYALVSHLKWSFWGIASAASSNVEGVDFLAFAQTRLAAYYEWKAKWWRRGLWPDLGSEKQAAKLACVEAELAQWKCVALGSVAITTAMAMMLVKARQI